MEAAAARGGTKYDDRLYRIGRGQEQKLMTLFTYGPWDETGDYTT